MESKKQTFWWTLEIKLMPEWGTILIKFRPWPYFRFSHDFHTSRFQAYGIVNIWENPKYFGHTSLKIFTADVDWRTDIISLEKLSMTARGSIYTPQRRSMTLFDSISTSDLKKQPICCVWQASNFLFHKFQIQSIFHHLKLYWDENWFIDIKSAIKSIA